MELIIQIVAGVLGGNIVGSLAKNLSLGGPGNTVVGAVGGAAGGQLLDWLTRGAGAAAGPGPGGFDLGAILQSIASGGIGGGVLMVVAGLIRAAAGRR